MLVQKTFHLPALRETAQAKLADLRGYCQRLANLEVADAPGDGRAHFAARLPGGFRADVDLVRVDGGNSAQTLFKSSRGNIEVIGIIEYFQIRPGLTEVVLTLDYTIQPWFFRWLDCVAHSVDRFLNRQLERVEATFPGPGHSRRPGIKSPLKADPR